MTTALEKIKVLVAALPHDKLRDLRDYCSMLLGAGGGLSEPSKPLMSKKTQAKVEARADDLMNVTLDAIVRHMEGQGVDFTTRYRLERSAQFVPFRHKFEELDALTNYFANAVKDSRVRRNTLVQIGVELLYQNLREMNAPVSSRTLMAHIHRLPSVIEKSFPGYARAGLLHLIVRNKGE